MKFIWENMVLADGCTITASSANTNFPVANVRSTTRAKEWRSQTGQVTNQWVQFSFTSPVTITTAAVLWEQNNYKLSPSAQIQLQGSALSSFSTVGVTVNLTLDNRQQMAYGQLTTNNSYQFWRIRIHDPSNSFDFVNIGHVFLGREATHVKFPSNGFSMTWNNNSEVRWNSFGQRFSIEKPIQKQLEFSVNYMSEDERSELLEVYWKARNKPIFVLLDPSELFFSNKDFWIYGYLTNDLELQHTSLHYTSSKLVIKEVL